MDFFYPPELPITAFLGEISAQLEAHQVVIIAGETGSGKTTQLPKLCLETFPAAGLVGCTQPRRIAATTVARRVAEELGAASPLVGSKVRFQDRTGPETKIKFMTDGVLLAETRNDPQLRGYSVIIVDEAHERSLNIDFLLGYLHRLLRRREDLKVLITSATIDTAAFAEHFGQAPVVSIEGRGHPVDVIYRPPEDEEETNYLEHCLEVTADICASAPGGDILVFLPTEKDIRTCCDMLRPRVGARRVLPLFGRLQARDQQLVFKDHKQAKVVVATNVAETSVTVPAIRYVVDSGLARISSYHPRSRTMRLPVTKISQASCNQRTGRGGRIGPGTCYRLFSEADFHRRPLFSTPEIQRANLAEVILQMIALDLGDPFAFPFLDPPKKAAIREGYRTLQELGAIDGNNRLTDHGRIMARLPIDPVISRIIIEAVRLDCLSEIIVIAAALAIQDPRIRPAEREHEADAAHRVFAAPRSDFSALLSIWKRFHDGRRHVTLSALKKYCKTHFLSFQRMREWLDLHDQLTRLLRRRRQFRFNGTPASFESIHRALLAGLFNQGARKKAKNLYQTMHNREIRIFPGSYQYNRSGDWIIAGSVIETSQLFAVTVATIEADWLETSAAPFCTYRWSTPRYDRKKGQVVATETVSLRGLVIASDRTVNYPKRDRKNIAEARQLFIQQALVEDRLGRRVGFLVHNRKLLQQWRDKEDKLRRKDIVIDDGAICAYYDDRLPAWVYDRASLMKYIDSAGDARLRMTPADILAAEPDENDLHRFPTRMPGTELPIRLSYRFNPGSEDDGVTAIIPAGLVDTIDPELFDWLVPGLLPEKTSVLLKSLPKRLRKKLVPLNDAVDRVLDAMDLYRGSYRRQLSAALNRCYTVRVHPDEWTDDLPAYLRMHFKIVDSAGTVMLSGTGPDVLAGRNIGAAAANGSLSPRPADRELIERLEQRLFTRWEFDGCPARIPLYLDSGEVGGYVYGVLEPIPEKHGVKLVYARTEADECRQAAGLGSLLQLQFKKEFKQIREYCRVVFSGPSSLWLAAVLGAKRNSCSAIADFITAAIAGRPRQPFNDKNQFDTMVRLLATADLAARGRDIIDAILRLLRERRQVAETIDKYESLSSKSGSIDEDLYSDLRAQLETILPGDFLSFFSIPDLDDASRYLRGLQIRCERAYNSPRKDRDKRARVSAQQRNIEQFREKSGYLSDECRDMFSAYRRLVAEFRLSIFAPEIKTAVPVSEKKVRQAWKELADSC